MKSLVGTLYRSRPPKVRRLDQITGIVIHRILVSVTDDGAQTGYADTPEGLTKFFTDPYPGAGFQAATCPYHFLVYPRRSTGDPATPTYQTLGLTEVGAHVKGANTPNIGIACVGDYRTPNPDMPVDPYRTVDGVVRQLVWLCSQLFAFLERRQVHLNVEAIVGHRDLTGKDCPGKVLYDRLPYLRERVAATLADEQRFVI